MSARLRGWFQSLRGACPVRAAVESTDAELVTAFALTQCEDAFVELVRRHGPMVLATCRRVLHPDTHAAEDAFQAAFLVLATKATTLRPPERVGAWLHGVAVHVAKKARTWVRRIAPSAPADLDRVPSPAMEPDPDAAFLRACIDEVMASLPAKYRAPVILCDLEGKSRAEAAAMLGCSEGTLSGRLARARTLLADRLARRGFVLPLAGLTAALLALPTTASVPAHLVASTVQTATLVAAGAAASEVTSEPIAALTRGGVPSMTTSFKLLVAGVTGVGLTLGGFGLVELPDARTVAAPPAPAPKLLISAVPVLVADEKPQPKGWVAKHTLKQDDPVLSLAVSANLIAVGYEPGGLTFWEPGTGKLKEVAIEANPKGLKSIAHLRFSADGENLYMISDNGTSIMRCIVDPKKRAIQGFAGPDRSVIGMSADAKSFLELTDKALLVRSNAFEDQKGSIENVLRHKADVKLAAIGDDGKAVTADADGVVRLWTRDVEAGEVVWSLELKELDPLAVAVAPEAKRIAVVGKTGAVVIDSKKGKAEVKLKGHEGEVRVAAFSPDGKFLATGGEDRTVRVFDAATGKEVAVLKGHTEPVSAIAFNPGGELLVTGSADKTVRVWEFKK